MAPTSKTASKMVDIRDRSQEELVTSLERARGELFRLKLQRATNQLENVTQIRGKRREVARILTVITERKNQQAGSPAPKRAE